MQRIKPLILLIITSTFLVGYVQNQKADNTNVIMETNEYMETTQNHTKIYILKTDKEEFIPQIFLNTNDKTFFFSYGVLSSYITNGTYTENHKQLELKTEDGTYHYTFDIVDDNTLKFNQENSSDVKFIDKSIEREIIDGSEFIIDVPNT
ncbi:MAG: hypothetical protein HFI05_15905 [Lachnospiraceae bacterium]|jgi:hypothetical protein|nr:hypothetical protein [Lachnospiraceae bacterium]